MPDTETTGPAGSAPDDRAEHLAFCKQRALEYADTGDAGSAIASLMSEFRKGGPAFADAADVVVNLMTPLAMTGQFERPGELRNFIEGFR